MKDVVQATRTDFEKRQRHRARSHFRKTTMRTVIEQQTLRTGLVQAWRSMHRRETVRTYDLTLQDLIRFVFTHLDHFHVLDMGILGCITNRDIQIKLFLIATKSWRNWTISDEA